MAVTLQGSVTATPGGYGPAWPDHLTRSNGDNLTEIRETTTMEIGRSDGQNAPFVGAMHGLSAAPNPELGIQAS